MTEEAGPTTSAFDFGAVLRMHSMDKVNAHKNGRKAKDPLLRKEHGEPGSSSSETTVSETRKVHRVTVDIESNKEDQAGVALMMDSSV